MNENNDDLESEIEIIMDLINRGVAFHQSMADAYMGQDIRLIAIHGHLIKKTIQTLNPGIWETTEIIMQDPHKKETGH